MSCWIKEVNLLEAPHFCKKSGFHFAALGKMGHSQNGSSDSSALLLNRIQFLRQFVGFLLEMR